MAMVTMRRRLALVLVLVWVAWGSNEAALDPEELEEQDEELEMDGFSTHTVVMEHALGSDGAWAKRFEPFEDDYFEGFSTSPSGLKYKIVEEGFGVKPLSGQKIKAHYAGYLLNGAKFDASYDRRSPLEFQVGVGRVIKGWDEALLDMKVGEKRVLKIPSNLAYGEKGAGGIIPPGATLVFFVELVTLAA